MADYIYLDNYIIDGSEYSGCYAGTEMRYFGRTYFGLKIIFNQEAGYGFPCNNDHITYIAQNIDSILGEKYQSLYNSHRFNSLVINESKITIKRSGSSYYFLSDGQYLGVISSEIAWSREEEEILWELYQTGVTISDIEKIFARESLDVNLKIHSLKSVKIPYKENIFDYFTDYFNDFKNKSFVISASSRDCLGEVRCNKDYQDKYPQFIEPEQTFFSAFNINFKDYKGQITFQYDKNKPDEIEINQKYSDSPIRKVLLEDIKNGYLSAIIKHLNATTDQCFGVISLEDFEIGSPYSSYYLAVTDNSELFKKFITDYIPSFLRYIGFLKTKYTVELLEKAKQSAEEVHKESIRSALTAISTRNMSHNLGGHLIYYTKLDIQRIADIFCKKNEKREENNDNKKNDEVEIPIQVKSTAPDIRGAAMLFSYLQGRMNHIATIIKEDKAPYLPVNVAAQFFKDLVIDEIPVHSNDQEEGEYSDYKKTTNFYLKELVRSENYIRPSVYSDMRRSEGVLKLSFEIWNDDSNRFVQILPDNLVNNSSITDIDLAMPGGILATHALYNILENFIRNAAKYHYIKPRPINLEICIKLCLFKESVEFVIHDTKGDANIKSEKGKTLFNIMSQQLINSPLIDKNDESSINKNLGLKEMLISALWLNSNEYDESLSEIFTKINDQPEERANILSKYGLSYVMVEGNNIIFPEAISKALSQPNNIEVGESANLGIRFTIPRYFPTYYMQGEMDNTNIVKANVVCFNDGDGRRLPKLEKRFPHFIYQSELDDNSTHEYLGDVEEKHEGNKDYTDYVALHTAVKKQFPNIDDYCLRFGIAPREPEKKVKDEPWKNILFSSHLSETSSVGKYIEYDKYSYVDSISGRDRTKILEGLLIQGISREKKKFYTWRDKSLCLQIKESALTRITIIDERFFYGLKWNNKEKPTDENKDKAADYIKTQIEQEYRGIRILNYFNQNPNIKYYEQVGGFDSLYGNKFIDNGPYKGQKNHTTFLSVHQGIIEKMLQNTNDPFITGICGDGGMNPFSADRVKKLMDKFKQVFFGDSPDSFPRICIHSGRGKLTKDLNDSLKGYPFINVTTLQGLYEDSKFLLCQLFYNLKF